MNRLTIVEESLSCSDLLRIVSRSLWILKCEAYLVRIYSSILYIYDIAYILHSSLSQHSRTLHILFVLFVLWILSRNDTLQYRSVIVIIARALRSLSQICICSSLFFCHCHYRLISSKSLANMYIFISFLLSLSLSTDLFEVSRRYVYLRLFL